MSTKQRTRTKKDTGEKSVFSKSKRVKKKKKNSNGIEIKGKTILLDQSLKDITLRWKNDKGGGHLNIEMEQIEDGKKLVTVGLTTTPKKGKDTDEYRVTHPPTTPKNNKAVFLYHKGSVERKQAYKNPRKGKIASSDLIKAEKISKKAKTEYLEKKAKKNNEES